jgi:uncharacterized protein YjiS (DUF1127 family)
MAIGQIWLNANPELRTQLRTVNEERAAAFYGVWRRVAGVLAPLTNAVGRVLRRYRTQQALSRLSDHHLKDIGISRSEILGVAAAVAEQAPGVGVTIAELRGAEESGPVRVGAETVPLPQAPPRGVPARPARRQTPAATDQAERAAS